jgi:hypothetical protein
MDTVGHGTFVAGVIASDNPYAPGVAPDARVIALKITPDGSEVASLGAIEQALEWVRDHRAEDNIVAVNLSFSLGNVPKGQGPEDLEPLYQELESQGVFIAVASGNDYAADGSRPGLNSLAASPEVAAVGAVWDQDLGPATWSNGARDYSTGPDRIASFTQRAPGLDLLAPGVAVLGLSPAGVLTRQSGTSVAAPFVAGAAVLLREALDRLGSPSSPLELLHLLQQTGVPVIDGAQEVDNVVHTHLAFARLDLAAALAAVGALPRTAAGRSPLGWPSSPGAPAPSAPISGSTDTPAGPPAPRVSPSLTLGAIHPAPLLTPLWPSSPSSALGRRSDPPGQAPVPSPSSAADRPITPGAPIVRDIPRLPLGPAVNDRPGQETIRESFLAALLDAIAIDRPHRGDAVGDAIGEEIALEILSGPNADRGNPPDRSATTAAHDERARDSDCPTTTPAPAILGLAAGLSGLVRGLWSGRTRPHDPVSRGVTDEESEW